MPEPYKFPDMPSESFVPKWEGMSPIRITCTDRPDVLIIPPCKGANWIGFAFVHGKEVLRFAFTVDDNMKMVCILEDGKPINPKELAAIACKISFGTENWEKLRESRITPTDRSAQTPTSD
jgi:hypothetical protein